MKVPPFISAALQRFFTANPLWAKRIQAASFALGVIAFIPDILTYLEIPSPTWIEFLHNKVVKIGALLSIVIMQIPNDNKS